jgi:RimJ/RimL family protein N-acetyltransferase
MADMLGRADNIVLRRGVLIVGHYCGGGMLMMHAFAAPSARGATVRRIVREYFRLAFRSEKDAMMIVGKIHPDNRPARHMAVACGMKPRRSDDDHCWYEVRRRG